MRNVRFKTTLGPISGLFYCHCIRLLWPDPKIIAKLVRKWLEPIGVRTLFIEPGSPWERKKMVRSRKPKNNLNGSAHKVKESLVVDSVGHLCYLGFNYQPRTVSDGKIL